MYRTFLSWRYLFARRTNLIGMTGIFVAVAALILIYSIMTGFLEESRRAVRGALADVLVEPARAGEITGVPIPASPQRSLEIIRDTDGVNGATARITWHALFTQGGDEQAQFESVLSSTGSGELLGVQLLGVDVRTEERFLQPALAASFHALGIPYRPYEIKDEFDATEFYGSLQRARTRSSEFIVSAAVDFPMMPFVPPRRMAREARLRKLAPIIVGAKFYDTLHLQKGDVVQLATVSPNSKGDDFTIVNRDFVLAGVFSSGENESDLSKVYMARSELQDFLGMQHNYSQILVRLDDYDDNGPQVAASLQGRLTDEGLIAGSYWGREVSTWEEQRGGLLGAIENERVLMAIMLGLVLIVAGFTIFAILSMMVTEKRRDIGILAALGATRSGILQTFLLIAFWDALIGSVFGVVCGIWAAWKIDPFERWLSSYTKRFFGGEIFKRDLYFFDHIPAIVQTGPVVAFVIAAFVCTLGFALIPAWRAARQSPLEGLRHE